MPTEPIRILLAAEQEIVRRGLQSVLADRDGKYELVEQGAAAAGSVDVVIFDVLQLVDGPSLDLIQLIDRSKGVVALSVDLRPDLESRARALGAVAVVSLGASGEDLWTAIDAVDRGESCVFTATEEWLGQEAGLTQRESDMFALVARGLTNPEIAAYLFLSVNSVKTYIRGAYAKVGVTRRSQAVAWALEYGFSAETMPPAGGPEPGEVGQGSAQAAN